MQQLQEEIMTHYIEFKTEDGGKILVEAAVFIVWCDRTPQRGKVSNLLCIMRES